MNVVVLSRDIDRLWHTGSPGSFVIEQYGRFAFDFDEKTTLYDAPNEYIGESLYDCDTFMLWSDSYLEAMILEQWFDTARRCAYIFWDQDLECYGVWVGNADKVTLGD